MKKKVLILFPEGSLPYSPTTLNLIQVLSAFFDVTVLANGYSADINLNSCLFNLDYFQALAFSPPPSILKRAAHKLRKKIWFNRREEKMTREHQNIYRQIKNYIRLVNPDIIIAIDLLALECCRNAGVHCVFLSLEIPSTSNFFSSLVYEKIDAVIIQNIERYNHLFKSEMTKPKFFILPNAPVFTDPSRRTRSSKKIIYNGYIWSAFGPQFCLNLITKYPEYELHLKGAINSEDMIEINYPHLKNSPALTLDSSYLTYEELSDYLLEFSIGFCFYNFKHPFINANKFNYETAPSGKLFTYLAHGLPVICSNIPAFDFLEKAGAGILLDDYSPDSLHSAINRILGDYQKYSDNALKLGHTYSFKDHMAPVVDFFNGY